MADAPDRPEYSFTPGPPPEASRFLRNKELRPAFSWQDVEPEEHAVAFSVAKATSADVLQSIRDELQTALDDGLPFAEFKRRLRPRLEELGWWGRQDVIDPDTGERVEARLGSPRRLRTIYRANLRSARAAGQWERIERTKDALPYLEYRLGPSEKHRDLHEEKQGLVLPVDDPFWSSWMPPNGWGCNCWVRQLSAGQAQRKGISASPDVPMRRWTNRRTGEVKQVPIGIDPGWERNPGQLRLKAMEDHLADRLVAADPAVARVALRDVATSWRAERVLAGTAEGAVPVGLLPDDLRAALKTEARVLQMVNQYGRKVAGKAAPVTMDVLALVPDALASGPAVLEQIGAREGLILLIPGEQPWQMVIKLVRERAEVWVSTMHRTTDAKWQKLLRRPGVTVVR